MALSLPRLTLRNVSSAETLKLMGGSFRVVARGARFAPRARTGAEAAGGRNAEEHGGKVVF